MLILTARKGNMKMVAQFALTDLVLVVQRRRLLTVLGYTDIKWSVR
jgi:hypothetical protein